MKIRLPSLLVAGTLLALAGFVLVVRSATPGAAPAVNPPPPTGLPQLAVQAVSANAAAAAAAIAGLRAAGPAGLAALEQVHAASIAAHLRADGPSADADNWPRVSATLDAVGQQRDCAASGLFWYTDLAAAEAAARAAGRPILSLRLLGNLVDEYSCANSRFFRTTLYANAGVGRYLRENFVLHWQSVRPVPRITIDMGDGRKIERTITGNSIHYVLDADGRPVDALPGLYGPQAFLAGLARAVAIVRQTAGLDGPARAAALRDYHQSQLAAIETQWTLDLQRVAPGAFAAMVPLTILTPPTARPDAYAANARSVSKWVVETPMLRAVQPGAAGGAHPGVNPEELTSLRGRLEAATSDASWTAIAALHAEDAQLDAASRRLIAAKQPPTATEAARMTTSKTIVENPLVRLTRNLERSIAEDTVRNECLLHARLHEWFVTGAAPAALDPLNRKIYAELFLTPDSDPWLGLAPTDVFSALDGGGLVEGPVAGKGD
jgi:hypothetical protein